MKNIFIFLLFFLLFSSALQASPDKVPPWVHTPSMDGYIGGIGITKVIPNKIEQEMIAMILAKADLLKSIKVSINSSLDITQHQDGSKKVEKSLKLRAKSMLKKSEKKAQWFDNEGNYYIWIVISNPHTKEKNVL